MTRSRARGTPVASLVIVATLALPVVATASPSTPEKSFCWDANAELEGLFTTEGCTSLLGLCTQGVITSSPGFLIGVFYFTVTGAGGGLVGESSIVTPPVEPGSTWSYSARMSITTWLGELHLTDVGVFDTAAGAVSEVTRVVGGTGIYAGATGILFTHGIAYPDGSGFSSELHGRLCVPLRRSGDDEEDDDEEDDDG